MVSEAQLLEKLEKCYSATLDLVLADAVKAASSTFVAFGDPNAATTAAVKKDAFAQSFGTLLREKFQGLMEAPKPTSKLVVRKKLSSKEEMEERISRYSLLSEDETEVQIATEVQTRLLLTENRLAFSFLSIRFEKLAGRPFIMTANPLSPAHLVQYFKTSTDQGTDNKKMAGMALKSWLKVMQEKYPAWLESLNQQLIHQQVLPDLDEADVNNRYKNNIEARREKAKEIRKNLISDITGKSAENSTAVLPAELMASLFALLQKASTSEPNLQHHLVAGSDKGPRIDDEDVVSALKGLTVEHRVNEATGYREDIVTPSLADLIKASTNLQTFALNEYTQNAIALISMMFSKILQEDSIAEPMKPLLKDLQLPVLKSALQDRKFFVDMEHPAQQLVNEITRAGSEWTPSENAQQDLFYQKIASIVDDVKEKHDKEEEVFERNLQELSDFLEEEEARVSQLQEAIFEQEQLYALEELAHSRARGAIAARVHNHLLPPVTQEFIDTLWEKVLFFHFHKNEEERSEEFKRALLDLEQLIDAVTVQPVEIVSLITALNRHLTDQGYAKEERQQRLQALANELKVVHRQMKKKNLAPEPESAGVTVPPAVAAEPEAANPEVANPVVVNPIVANPGVINFDVARVVEPSRVADIPAPEHPRDQFDEQAASLATNSWFHLSRPPAPEKVKVKLALIIKSTGTYVFINREGMKVLSLPRAEVAAKLRDATLTVLETSQHFDRALESVIRSMRHS